MTLIVMFLLNYLYLGYVFVLFSLFSSIMLRYRLWFGIVNLIEIHLMDHQCVLNRFVSQQIYQVLMDP